MKRLYLAVFFLAICIGLCVYEQLVIDDLYDTSISYIDRAIEYADNEEYEKAGELCAELNTYWDKRYSVITSMAEHGVVDDAGIIIDILTDEAENDTEALHSDLAKARVQVRLVRDTAKISFGNIF